MMNLNELISNIDKITLVDLFNYWDNQDDIFMIKHDGARDENRYTFVIIGNNARFEPMRLDCNDLLCGLTELLSKYRDKLNELNKKA